MDDGYEKLLKKLVTIHKMQYIIYNMQNKINENFRFKATLQKTFVKSFFFVKITMAVSKIFNFII